MVGEQFGSRGFAPMSGYLEQAAREFGTPVYVVDAASVAAAAAAVENAFPEPWIRQFSVKANDLPAVISTLHERGWGANVVSSGEWELASAAGVANDSVTIEGIGKTDADLDHAVRVAAAGTAVRWLALESAAEALHLAGYAESAGLGRGDRPPLDVLLRLNPKVQPETLAVLAVGASTSKFGMDQAEIMWLVQQNLEARGLRVRGIHVHVGSDLRDVTAWAAAGVLAVRLLDEISRYVANADTIDFGGGFPLPAEGRTPTPGDFQVALTRALEADGLQLPSRRGVEPGRYLVGAAGWLVSRVLHSRSRAPYAQQVVLDAGMTELIRPALYGSYHRVHALPAGRSDDGVEVETAVEGPVCESTDSFGIHPLPHLQRGDLVAIEGAGAYGASFTSRYNGRPQPVEVMVHPDSSLQRCERAAITALEAHNPPAAPTPQLDLALTTKELYR